MDILFIILFKIFFSKISGPDTDWAYWFNSVPKGAKTGKDNGFSVLFDIESYDYGYYDEGSEGLKGSFNNYVDKILTFFDNPLPLVDKSRLFGPILIYLSIPRRNLNNYLLTHPFL